MKLLCKRLCRKQRYTNNLELNVLTIWLGFGLGILACNYASFIVIIIVSTCNVYVHVYIYIYIQCLAKVFIPHHFLFCYVAALC